MNMLTKTQKKERCRNILHNTRNIVDEQSSAFLLEQVFPNHPEWDEKVGIGVDHLEVRPDGHGGRCFYIVRRDGTFTDISFLAAISPPQKKADVIKACREVIRPMIKRMKESIKLPFICPITGEMILDRSEVHIDHYDLTFKELFDEWVKDKDIERLYGYTLKSNKDNDTETYFDNDEICKDFLEFHNQHTHLRAVSRKANQSLLKGARDYSTNAYQETLF